MFWIVSKTLGVVLQPMVWILIANLLALCCLWRGWRKSAILCIAFTPLFLGSLKFLNLAAHVATPLEHTYPAQREIPADARGLIVLGGAVENIEAAGPLLPLTGTGERVMMAVYVRSKRTDLPIVLTGASRTVTRQFESEAVRIEAFLERTFEDAGSIIIDDKSLNTAAHPVELKQIIPDWQEGNWLLTTSAVHMPRAVAVFEKQGWNVTPFPTDFMTDAKHPASTNGKLLWSMRTFSRATHEWFGLLIYKLTGKI